MNPKTSVVPRSGGPRELSLTELVSVGRREQGCQKQYHDHLGELGWLEIEEPERDPALGAVDRLEEIHREKQDQYHH
jgi:hypothetical protein